MSCPEDSDPVEVIQQFDGKPNEVIARCLGELGSVNSIKMWVYKNTEKVQRLSNMVITYR